MADWRAWTRPARSPLSHSLVGRDTGAPTAAEERITTTDALWEAKAMTGWML